MIFNELRQKHLQKTNKVAMVMQNTANRYEITQRRFALVLLSHYKYKNITPVSSIPL